MPRRIDEAERVEGMDRDVAARAPSNFVSRSRISAAARRVNVTARQFPAATPRSATRCAIRCVSVRVLPAPGPAMISSGPSTISAARRCSGSSRRGHGRCRSGTATAALGKEDGRAESDARRAVAASTMSLFVHRRFGASNSIPPSRFSSRPRTADHAVFAVIAGVADHLAGAQPRDRLGQHRGLRARDVLDRDLAEDREFRPERADHAIIMRSTVFDRDAARARSRTGSPAAARGSRPRRRSVGGVSTSSRSASTSTRCSTPTVTFSPQTGQRPPCARVSFGVRRTSHLRWPSR